MNNIGEEQRCFNETMGRLSARNIYGPIYVNGVLLYESDDRPFETYKKRIDLLPNLSGQSIIDIGCSTGYFLQEFKRRGADRCIGLEKDEISLTIAQYISERENLDIEYVLGEFPNVKPWQDLDNILFFTMASYEEVFENELIHALKSLGKRCFYESPSSTAGISYPCANMKVEEIEERYFPLIRKHANVKYLGHTGYKNQLMLQLDF